MANKIISTDVTGKHGEFPIMGLAILNESGEVISRGYLSPFRRYKFQVSMTEEGEGDRGSSQVIGLKHIFDIHGHENANGFQSNLDTNGIIRELLLGQALIAINKYASKNDAIVTTELVDSDESTIMGKFLEYTHKYLKSH